ncbi:hypothetical protein H0H92_010455, partial [Tricholoma furcatifolium]
LQIALILADYKKSNPWVAVILDECTEVVKWFNNHSFALGMLNREQLDIRKVILALIIPVITRWTTFFCCLRRLLEVNKPLTVTASKYAEEILETIGPKQKAKDKAHQVLRRVKDDEWWKKVVITKTHIEPLAIAVNIAQAANTRCDHDARMNDRTFPTTSDEDMSHPLTSILESIEKRWLKCDQDLYLACFWLNPYINPNLRNDNALPIAVLFGIIKRLYSRILPDDAEGSQALIPEAYDYHNREGMFSEYKWPLASLKQAMQDPDGSINPIVVWKILNKSRPLVKALVLEPGRHQNKEA